MIEAVPLGPETERLLAAAGLPVADLAGRPGLNLLGMREGGDLVGVVGVEVHGAVGLLRSLAVAPARRGGRLGVRLVAAAEALAVDRGIDTLYLLTTTAEAFFRRLGYEVVPRTEAPPAIAATPQFSDLCPSSSVFMRKRLGSAQ